MEPVGNWYRLNLRLLILCLSPHFKWASQKVIQREDVATGPGSEKKTCQRTKWRCEKLEELHLWTEYSSKTLMILTWITANIRDTVQHVHLFNDLPKLSRQGVFKVNKFWRHAACLVRKCHGNHVRPSYPMTFPADGVWGVGLLGVMLRPLRKAPVEQRQMPENNFYYDPVVCCSWSRDLVFYFYFYTAWLPTPQVYPNPGMWKWYEMMTSLFFGDISMAWGEAMASAGCGGYRCV